MYMLLLFTPSLVDDHLGYLHFLANMNNAAMNFHVYVFVWMYVFIFLRYQEVELLGHIDLYP